MLRQKYVAGTHRHPICSNNKAESGDLCGNITPEPAGVA